MPIPLNANQTRQIRLLCDSNDELEAPTDLAVFQGRAPKGIARHGERIRVFFVLLRRR
jgi:hypothetical protein